MARPFPQRQPDRGDRPPDAGAAAPCEACAAGADTRQFDTPQFDTRRFGTRQSGTFATGAPDGTGTGGPGTGGSWSREGWRALGRSLRRVPVVRRVVPWLPRGGGLPEGERDTVHRALRWLMLLHVPALLAICLGVGCLSPVMAVFCVLVPAVAGGVAWLPGLPPTGRALAVSAGLVGCSLIVSVLTQSPVDSRFHALIVLSMIALYESWAVFGLSLGLVIAVTFLFVGPLVAGIRSLAALPQTLPGGLPLPGPSGPVMVAVHLGFFTAACGASLVGWRLREISRLHQASFAAALRHRLRHDLLTGLPNLEWLLDGGGEPLPDDWGSDGRLAMLVVHVGRLSQVNDILGHYAGDQLLVHVAGRLAAAARPGEPVIRVAGGEFAVVLTGPRADDPLSVAHRLWRSLGAERVPYGGVELGVQVVIGVAAGAGPASREQLSRLLRRADVAMIAGKRARRAISEYDPAADRLAVDRLAVLADLQEALYGDQLKLFYQPQISLADGAVIGVEALLRWHHPVRGVVPPMDFVPAAEATNLIIPLTYRVLTLTLIQAAMWHQSGHDLRMSVNVPPACLAEADFVDTVVAALEATDVPAHLLCLELTETSFMDDPVGTKAVMVELQRRGVALSLDDFGTGFSALNYLRDLPAQELKIDKAFVQGMMTADSPDHVVVESTISLAHRLGMKVVAEGVEDVPTEQALVELGCDLIQGYLHAPALPADQLTEWLAGRRTSPVLP